MNKDHHPRFRKIRVRKAIRRYSRVVYMNGGTFTVLEDPKPEGMMLRYTKDMVVDLELLYPSGIYKDRSNPTSTFAGHELDALAKDGVFEELSALDLAA